MNKEDAGDVITILDTWPKTQRTAIDVIYSQGRRAFPYDDSGERCDQILNAIYLAQRLLDQGAGTSVSFEVDHVGPELPPRYSALIVNGSITVTGIDRFIAVGTQGSDDCEQSSFSCSHT